jgi:hypothetical protein
MRSLWRAWRSVAEASAARNRYETYKKNGDKEDTAGTREDGEPFLQKE